jgi:hypothetical protein
MSLYGPALHHFSAINCGVVLSKHVATTAEKRFTTFCILMVVLVHLSLLSVQWHNVQAARPDFASLYAAGRLALSGGETGEAHAAVPGFKNKSLFSLDGQTFLADRLHPPFEMMIFAPLALLNYQAAYLVWYGCNLIMLIGVPILLWNYIPNLHLWFGYVVILVATFFPVFVTIVQGQDSILLLFLLTLCFTCMKERRELLGGVILALGMFKFTLIIPIVAALVVMRRWRVLVGFASGFLALLLATVALFGPGAIPGYLRFISHRGGGSLETVASEPIMPNLRGFLHSLAAGAAPPAWVDFAVVIGSAVTFALISRRWAAEGGNPSALDLLFSMQVITAAIVSYHLYVHDASVLLLPILLTLNRLAGSTFRTFLGASFVLSVSIMYLVPFIATLRVSMPLFFCASVLLLGGLFVSFRGATVQRTV